MRRSILLAAAIVVAVLTPTTSGAASSPVAAPKPAHLSEQHMPSADVIPVASFLVIRMPLASSRQTVARMVPPSPRRPAKAAVPRRPANAPSLKTAVARSQHLAAPLPCLPEFPGYPFSAGSHICWLDRIYTV